jgi:hypothetical protein
MHILTAQLYFEFQQSPLIVCDPTNTTNKYITNRFVNMVIILEITSHI